MNYEFPIIKHLDDVRPAIEGRDEFIIAERDWGYVVNYMVSMTDTFPPVLDEEYWCPGCKLPIAETEGCGSQRCPDLVNLAAIRRECRGLLFYKDGTIMMRRLHKFFNVNERDETQVGAIDFTQPHVILEKLDGSMITPVVTDAGIRWGTKMGITDVGMGAELFVAHHPNYAEFAELYIERGKTPIFEWCSRKQRIVIDYPEDRLVLIAIRNNETGEYASYKQLQTYAEAYNIDIVKTYEGTADNMSHLMDETKAAEGLEGYIIRFDDGHMLKVKGEWYLRIHKTKDNLTHEKNVIDLLVNEKMDDVKAFMMDEDRKRVDEFETMFWAGVASKIEGYERYFKLVLASGLDRKRYALEWMPTIKENDPFAPKFVFARFNGKDPRELIIEEIRKHTGTQTKIDAVRHLWGDAQWNYYFNGDA
jgi:T4 RnlA family RNA ligase